MYSTLHMGARALTTSKNPSVLSKSKATQAILIGVVKIEVNLSRMYVVEMKPASLVHPPTPEALAYIATFTPAQKKLHELAIEKLGSSYFVERTRGFEKYREGLAKSSGSR